MSTARYSDAERAAARLLGCRSVSEYSADQIRDIGQEHRLDAAYYRREMRRAERREAAAALLARALDREARKSARKLIDS